MPFFLMLMLIAIGVFNNKYILSYICSAGIVVIMAYRLYTYVSQVNIKSIHRSEYLSNLSRLILYVVIYLVIMIMFLLVYRGTVKGVRIFSIIAVILCILIATLSAVEGITGLGENDNIIYALYDLLFDMRNEWHLLPLGFACYFCKNLLSNG